MVRQLLSMRGCCLAPGLLIFLFASCNSTNDVGVNDDALSASLGDRFRVITYNTQHDHSIGSYNWSQKLTHFANEVVGVYRPTIIALQEVYLRGDCNTCTGGIGSDPCTNMDQTEYLKFLGDAIQNATGVRYLNAVTLRNHDAALGLLGQCHQWQGNTVLYDPTQVNFYPYNLDNGKGCTSWFQIDLQEKMNDCLPLPSDNHEVVTRSVFEFPKGSNRFFNFYNTHLNGGDANLPQISLMMSWVMGKQYAFAKESFPGLPSGGRIYYPPIVVGDMNRATNSGYDSYYDQAPYSIDKIFIGKEYLFPNGEAWIVPVENSLQNFSGYSDHGIKMLELRVIDLASIIMSILSVLNQ